MGDRYTLDLNCAYCKKENQEIWYAPTCAVDTFVCCHCKKINFIKPEFEVLKLEDVKLEDVIEGFDFTTSISRSEAETRRICQEHLERLQIEQIKLSQESQEGTKE